MLRTGAVRDEFVKVLLCWQPAKFLLERAFRKDTRRSLQLKDLSVRKILGRHNTFCMHALDLIPQLQSHMC